jgi:hypothetical protein
MRDGVTSRTAEPETGTYDAGHRKPETAKHSTANARRPGAKRSGGEGRHRESDDRYRELVRLAYFVQPGRGKRIRRMAMARRIVESTGGLGGGYPRRLTRVLRRAMRPSPLWRIGLRPWLRATPSRMPAVATTNALATLEPPVRVAYVLLKVAGMNRYEARDQLLDLRIHDQLEMIEAAEKARVPVIRTWPHSDPFAPGRIKPLDRRSPVPVGVAVALTLVLVGTLAVVQGKGRLLGGTSTAAAHGLSLVAAAPEAWRTAPHSLDVWPARGDLTGDKNLTGRALKAWAQAAKTGGAGAGRGADPQLLFAGHVDGKQIALVRHGDRVGRFTGPNGPISVSRVSADPAAPVYVSRGRYLVAPWERAMSLTGKKLMVRRGITDAVFPRTRCGRGPVMHLSAEGKSRTVGEFGGPRGIPLAYRAPTSFSKAKTSGRTVSRKTRLGRRALRVWERTACVTPRPMRPVSQATAWEFWSGLVPLGGGQARWVCTGMTYADGGSTARAALLDKRGTRKTGRCDPRRPVGGSWWRSALGNWYYLAVSARGLTPRAKGPFQASSVRQRLLFAVPSEPKRRPTGPVTLTARRS